MQTDLLVWFLVATVLAFFMQCGFTMVETGFIRAKNVGNIIMKNFADFCIGAIAFLVIGYSILQSSAYFSGIIGVPNFDLLQNFSGFLSSDQSRSFVIDIVYCTTAVTIVSGAMAERTKFGAYCIYSIVMSALVYPIEAGWVLNSQGWLNNLGFTDCAGSCTIHMVGGITALIGAWFVGPRTDKYRKDPKKGVIANAIPGHAIPLAALGCFILWFGWYGFNGASASSAEELVRILIVTTLAPAAAMISCMIFTWWKSGHPDVSMCLNAVIAGLVSVTAGCAYVDAAGAVIIGAVSGVLVVVGVELIEKKLHVDDPVGAIAVHGINGLWGTFAVGLFDTQLGLFYSGTFNLLLVQLLGILAIGAFTAVCMIITFFLIKKFVGLRVTREDEIVGLDMSEHSLPTVYADFQMAAPVYDVEDEFDLDLDNLKPVQITDASERKGERYTKITIICNDSKFGVLKDAMAAIGVTGMTVSNVVGCGVQKGRTGRYRGVRMSMNLLPKLKVDIVVSTVDPGLVVAVAQRALYSGNVGDGKIFVTDVTDVMRVRTGSMGKKALNDED